MVPRPTDTTLRRLSMTGTPEITPIAGAVGAEVRGLFLKGIDEALASVVKELLIEQPSGQVHVVKP